MPEPLRVSESGWLTQTDSRAPTSKDKGIIWLFKDGTTIRMYVRDWITGTWRGPTNFT